MNNIEKAVTELAIKFPFFASFLFRKPICYWDSVKVVGVSPSGQIFANFEVIKSYRVDEIVFLLAHEILHLVFLHPFRQAQYDPAIWNVACDVVVCQRLFDDQIGCPVSHFVPWTEMDLAVEPNGVRRTAEQVYEEIKVPTKQKESNPNNSKTKTDDSKSKREPEPTNGELDFGEEISEIQQPADGEALNDGARGLGCEICRDLLPSNVDPNAQGRSKDELKDDIMGDIAQSISSCKSVGKVPLYVKRALAKYRQKEKIVWHDVLSDFLKPRVGQLTSWHRPNRRFESNYLPSWGKELLLGDVVIGIDTSGSIQAKELICFEKHVKDILEDCRPTSIKVVYCDCEIQRVDHFDQPSELKFSALGGGGTNMGKIVEWCRAHKETAIDCCIIFTDGDTPYPSIREIGDLNLIWLILNCPNEIPEWINTVRFTMD